MKKEKYICKAAYRLPAIISLEEYEERFEIIINRP